jgi:uncharacterized membrane protein YebE (DUF533 family)
MAEQNQFLQVIRVWAGLAWADDVIAPEEAVAMKKLIDGAALGDDEKTTALGYLDSKVELDTGSLSGLNEVARAGIYKAAVRLAGVDKEFSPDERRFLDRLREGLELADDVAQKIEADIPMPE